MDNAAKVTQSQFAVGQLVHHLRFDYRGVIVDVDPCFLGSDEWYDLMAKSRPPKDKPWYHVLVHDASHTTYVAEQNLQPDKTGKQVRHPLLEQHFSRFDHGRYIPEHKAN